MVITSNCLANVSAIRFFELQNKGKEDKATSPFSTPILPILHYFSADYYLLIFNTGFGSCTDSWKPWCKPLEDFPPLCPLGTNFG